MLTDAIRALQSRTDSKIGYAEIHLEELRQLGHPDGSEFDRAHQESFLLHLLGTRDALLAELNEYYSVGLPAQDLTQGKLRHALKKAGKTSEELARLYKLEEDNTSWYSVAKTMRDHTTHVGGVPRAFYLDLGGEHHRKVKLKHPTTGQIFDEHFPDTFDRWLKEMRVLVGELRASAMKGCGIG
jgi:hypothetical protein